MEPKFNTNSSLFILLPLLITVLLPSRLVTAQSPPPTNSNSQNGYFQPRNFTSSILIIGVLLITGFFLFGFFSVFIRQCTSEVVFEHGPGMQTPVMNRQPRGLDRAVIRTLPVMLYSEVKKHKVGKRALECAVCLSEFEDEDMLRLLPKCSHAFHPDCIDPWFEGHVTCPVCRCNLTDYKSEETSPSAGTLDYEGSLHRANQITLREEERSMSPESPLADHMVVEISTETEDERRDIEEMTELLRIRTVRRAARPKSSWRPPRFPRSHSTGHSLSRMCHTGDEPDHYTLRIPEHVLRQIIAEGGLKRSTSLVALKEIGDGNLRPAFRNGGEGSSRGGRSVMMFVRDISGRFAAWGMGRRGNVEGSVKGDGSTVRV